MVHPRGHLVQHSRPIITTLMIALLLGLGTTAYGFTQTPTPTMVSAFNATLPLHEAYLKASNTEANDAFGGAIAVDGETIVVGAPLEDSAATGINGNQANNSAVDAGAVYVFVRSGGTWMQQAYLKASNTGAGDQFGSAVSITADTIVVGAPFEDSAATGINGNQADNTTPDAGAVYVFVRSGSTWTQQAYLKASNAEEADGFGLSVASDTNRILVGAPYEDSISTAINGDQQDNSLANAGSAYLYERINTVWSQEAYLKSPHYPTPDGFFGETVALEASTIAIGAPFVDLYEARIGVIVVFGDNGTNWVLQGFINSNPWGSGDRFGRAIAINNHQIAVGADAEDSNATFVNGDSYNNSALNAGAITTFGINQWNNWQQTTYIKASNTQEGDGFGGDVTFCGTTLISGASGEDSASTGIDGIQTNNSVLNAGAAYRYIWDGATWQYRSYIKASNTDAGDSFGSALACDETTLVVGAIKEDSAATGVNGNQDDNTAIDAGAVYVLSVPMQGYTHLPYVMGVQETSVPYPLPQR